MDFLEGRIYRRIALLSGRDRRTGSDTADRIAELEEIIRFWKGNTHKDCLYANLPAEAISAQDDVGAVNIVNFMHGGCGHLTPPWPWLFTHGLKEVIRLCDQHMAELEMWTVEGIEKHRFYLAAKTVCQAMIDYAHRYRDLAAELAEQEAGR